jgi:hypothetical protein
MDKNFNIKKERLKNESIKLELFINEVLKIESLSSSIFVLNFLTLKDREINENFFDEISNFQIP